MKSILLILALFGITSYSLAQLGAEESVRKWYDAYARLDSTGFFDFWALDHKDFVYAHDGEVLKSEQFIDLLNNTIKYTEEISKASIIEGHLHEISNDAACYTAKANVEGIYSSGSKFSFIVTATFVLSKTDSNWKCIQCSASHIFSQ